MPERRPLVIINGRLRELPFGDTLPGGGGGTSEQFDARDIILNGETFVIDSFSQRIIREQLLIEEGGLLITDGRLFIET